ncbi:MAG: Phosphoglycerol transferase, alkaline phosphatase superfamily [Herbinix sp.]|jgi:phosphoglycerol transferase MdoB-like AlkP superfamily enzyme|nr:Phosphoglycerol transferase, alkaline phosphatase superfamily [Herbinix sp.]
MNLESLHIKIHWNDRKSIPVYLFIAYYAVLLLTYLKKNNVSGMKQDSLGMITFAAVILIAISIMETGLLHKVYLRFSTVFESFLLLLSPVISFVMVEMMVGNYNWEMFRKYSLYNVVWYGLLYLFLYAVIRNIKIAILLGNGIIYILAIANYLVFQFRGNPIIPSDIFAWRTGMSVASSYELNLTKGFFIASVMMYGLFALAWKMYHNQEKKKRTVLSRLVGLILFFAFYITVTHNFFNGNFIESKIRVIDFFAPKYTYFSYGTAFGFVANLDALKTEAPEGYTIDQVEEVFSHQTKTTMTKDEKPNIIVIMNEAFSDLSLINDYETNMDYLPNIRALQEDTVKGNLYVSVFGGATSDTEYEFLTGNSMAVMPSNCVPYQQFVTDETDSLASTLKEQGYYNIAIHPYKRSGYKRDIVYPLLGFDEFLSMENFKNPHTIRGFISDQDSYHKIIEEYETKGDRPLFIFNVTMQNHGGYSEQTLFEDDNNVKLVNMEGYADVEQYLSLVRESDKAFQMLLDYFKQQEEPTIILMYGDHQPVAYSRLHDELIIEGAEDYMDHYADKYKVPFILWSNFDIPEENIGNISANFLSSYLLKVAGVQGTEYNQYLLDLYEEIPVINAYFYMDRQNRIYPISDQSEYADRVKEYRYVGYNNALDKRERLDEFYSLGK